MKDSQWRYQRAGRFRKRLLSLLVLGTLTCLLLLPTTTRQGVNFQVSVRRIPWGIKGLEFLLRDYEYRQLAMELTRGLPPGEQRAVALLRWTHDHIRPTPPGWPVIDDHVSHIIIRGYGEEDQMADVFTTLATYTGIPSFWKPIKKLGEPVPWVLSFAKIEGQWTVWDVAGGIAFRNSRGDLVDVEEFSLYREDIRDELAHFSVPRPLRAERQMLGPRILFEFSKIWHRGEP